MNIRKSIRTIILMLALFMGAANGAWALGQSDIVFDPVSPEGGTVAFTSVAGQTVTITVTPDEGHKVRRDDIVVQKLQNLNQAQSRRRAPAIADRLTVSGPVESESAADYTFEVPTGYAGALVSVTFSAKDAYTFHIIDMSGHIVVEQSGDFNALEVPAQWRSPLVETYRFYRESDFDVINGIYTLKPGVNVIPDFASAPKDIYVKYDPSTTYDLDGSENRAVDGKKYLLKFAGGTSFRQEKDDWFEADANEGIYPYINGEGGLFVYGQDKLDATTEGVVSTRTRYAWYLEGGDPYRLRISSLQTKTDGVENTHYSYLRTYKPQGYDKVVTGVISNNPTAYDASDDAHAVRHKPTDYMVLNGTNGHFKLVTSDVVDDLDGNAANDERATVTSFENYWKTNPTALDALINNSETGNPLQRPNPDLTDEVRKDRRSKLGKAINDNGGLTTEQVAVFEGLGWHTYNVWANGTTWTESKKFRYDPHWFQTIDVGTKVGNDYNGDFDLVEYKLDGALILLDQHGWEVMRKPITTRSSDKETYKAALRKYDSPMVKMYHFWTNFIKEDGYHKYKPVRGNTNASKNAQHKGEGTSLADYPEVASTGTLDDIYVTYEVMGTYRGRYTGAATQDGTDASNSKYLIRQGTNYAKTTDGSTITAEPVANISDVSTAGEELLWYVKPNFNIDAEMGYNYSGSYGEKTQAQTEDAYFNNIDEDAVYDKTNGQNGFDPYNLLIQSVKYPEKFFKTNATDAVLDGSGGMQSTYTGAKSVTLGDYGQAFVASDYYNIGTGYQMLKVTNSTFMAVSDANGNIRLMPRFDHHNVATSITTLDEQQTAASMGDESGPQTTLFVLPRASISEGTVYSSDEITDMNGNYTLHEAFDVTKVIGTKDNPFKGTIDGQLHTINGVGHPLVAYADGAIIKNVILKNVTISTGNDEGDAGAICCKAYGSTSIYNCGILPSESGRDANGNITFSGSSVSGTRYVGGIVGLLDGTSRVINCYSYANITGGNVRAGIVGYNNYASKYNDLKTMVMNCMFYGNITTGDNVYPIYGGEEISNDYNANTANRLNNYDYFLYEAPFSKDNHITEYKCALAAEERFLVRFEFYRHLLNSTRELAAWYATGTATQSAMAKWVLDKSIAPYPILKVQGTYPSVVNYAPSDVMIDDNNEHRNEGRKLGTLTVNISIGSDYPTDAAIKTGKSQITLTRTDKDPDNYNFNYDKIQLPYYNEVGTGNCTHNKAVTGWKITSMTNGTQGTFTASDTWDGYNFADRAHYAKDLNGTSGRVFSQGGYFNVPEGVTAINIEPYWANAVYLSDACYDRYGYGATDDLTQVGGGQRYTGGNTYSINGDDQVVYTTIGNALGGLDNATSVYDNAVVLVGNYHHSVYIGNGNGDELASNKDKAFTIMSIDLNEDNEPDYSLIFRSGKQKTVSPIRYDFINVPAMAMAHKMATHGDLAIPGNCKPLGWFEITTTALMRFNQFEYDSESKKIEAPIILMGGVIEQFVSTNGNPPTPWRTNYLLFGDNVWFKVCSNGCHMEKTYGTPHIPVSVTGGDYEKFYLSGYFSPKASAANDNAEGYIDGGRFGEVAGAGQEEIKGNVTWLIDHADIDNFYAGGVNAAKAIKGDISTTIKNSHVGVFCGGPKFGDMASTKTIGVTATNCTFGTYFGAGYGGTSSYRHQVYNVYQKLNYNEWNTKLTSNYKSNTRGYYKVDTSKDIDGILYDYEYELFGGSTGNVHRLYMLYASFSKAQTNNASSTLTGCTVTGNFYGAGSLGAVVGDVTSTLNNTKVLGSAFGAGYSVTIPKVDVRDLGSFDPEPSYNETTAVYVKAGFPNTTQYEWTTVESLSSGDNALDDSNHTIKTTLPTSGLGSVTGNVTLTLEGNTTVNGSVFGGGESSSVMGTANKVTVNIEGNTQIHGNVFGGGDEGVVEGSTEVNIRETPPETP